MADKEQRHWTHPQTIPRGFLRVYMLATLSKGPTTGYEFMNRIEEKTEGAWRPGAGTIYPMLKGLMKAGLASPSGSRGKVSYSLSDAGQKELATMRAEMATFGRKEKVIMRLVADLMPTSALVPLLLNRNREGSEFLRSKIIELSEPDRTAALRELSMIAQNQLDWAQSNLSLRRPNVVRPKLRR